MYNLIFIKLYKISFHFTNHIFFLVGFPIDPFFNIPLEKQSMVP